MDFPSKADEFLSLEEKEFAMCRINQDRGDAEEDKVELRTVLHHQKDWKLYGWAFNLMASTLSGSAYAYILPSRWHKVFTTKAQLLTTPSLIFTVITYIRAGQATSVKSMRGPVIIMARGNRSLRSAPCGV